MSADKASPLGRRVRELRKSQKYSAQRLSDLTCGAVTRCVLTDLENGRRRDLSLSAGVAVARVFGLSAEQLINAEIPLEAFTAAHEIAIAKKRLEEILSK